jgi:transposase
MSTIARFIGLDVHKDSIVIATAEARGGEPGVLGTVAGTHDAVIKQLKKLGPPDTLYACYEAGPTGYGLYRALMQAGILCSVIAPSKVPTQAGNRIKTDRRDAMNLARYLRSGDLAIVAVPDERTEGMRDVSRAREDAKTAERVARQQLGKLLLRHGRTYPGKTTWTAQHLTWIGQQKFTDAAVQRVLDDYLATVERATARVRELDKALAELCDGWEKGPLVKALQALRGVRLITAIGIVAELGDLQRFATARKLMGFLGLVPSEHSTGGPDKHRRGRITRTGNGHVRRLLVESAWSYRFLPRMSRAIRERNEGLDPAVRDIAWKAQQRLHTKYRKLLRREKPKPQIVTAVARELAGFIWAIGQLEMFNAT